MNDDGSAKAGYVRRVARWALAVALAAAVIGLFATRHTLSAVKAERAELIQWQAGILARLDQARRPSDIGGGAVPLAAADAGEALAEIIASRDGALELLQMPKPYALSPPVESTEGAKPGAGKAAAPEGITQLLRRQSTGAAADDVNSVETDSQAPWKGWE